MKAPQPSALNCFVCGVENRFGLHIRFFNTAPGEVSADIIFPDAYQGLPGLVHGGIVATALDEVTSRTVFSETRIMVTARLETRYRNPVPLNTPLKLVGRAVEDKGKVCKARGQLLAPDGTLLAEAEAVLVEVAPEYLNSMTSIDKQGWQVYPEDYEKRREEES